MKKKYSRLKNKIKLYIQINWIKTIYLNFKMLSFDQAKKLPIIVFGKCSFKNIEGKIVLEGESFFGRIGIGQKYQIFEKEKGISEFHIAGELRFQGRAQFGTDCRVYVGEKAIFTLGDMASIGGDSSLICTQEISLGRFCRMGTETFMTDSNFHAMKNTVTGEIQPKSFEINLGNYNFIATRVSILGKTKTPDYCTIASCTLINKDFSELGENILVGGVPAKLIKQNLTRDWDGEKQALEEYLKI